MFRKDFTAMKRLIRKFVVFKTHLSKKKSSKERSEILKIAKDFVGRNHNLSGYVRIPKTKIGIKFSGYCSRPMSSEIRKTKKAKKLLSKCGIYVPEVYGSLKTKHGQTVMVLEHIDATAKHLSAREVDDLFFLMEIIDVRHNDLHSGNILITKNQEIVIIDWELADL